MSDALEFTDEEIRIIKGLYTAADSAKRRQFVRDALDLQSGEEVEQGGGKISHPEKHNVWGRRVDPEGPLSEIRLILS